MFIAALGDIHGQWQEAMILVEWACVEAGIVSSDLAAIFQVGDAEALRCEAEITQVPGPSKYRKLGDFPHVLDGTIIIPAPLFFIAGNHEPFAALDADGGLVVNNGRWGDNVTYLGRAGVVIAAGLRVGFLSGIWSQKMSGLNSKVQKREGRTAAHYTEAELTITLEAAKQGRYDVLITHDWPAGLTTEQGCPVGDANVRKLIETTQATLSLHGHLHAAHSEQIAETEAACLAMVGRHCGNPLEAVGIWQIMPGESPARRLV
ncbi:MAG: metallophosphoesterase [Peptococcaceae bacterium]|nr:metallophosphoesterase [Peptococcaceae bacterium]